MFTPGTAVHLSESMRLLMESDVPEILISLSSIEPWDREALDLLTEEYERLSEDLLSYYKKTGTIPINENPSSVGGIVFI